MIKLLKFSFLPSFYCSVSIWCSKDQLKSLVTVETSPDCPHYSRLPAPRPKGFCSRVSNSPPTHTHTCPITGPGSAKDSLPHLPPKAVRERETNRFP